MNDNEILELIKHLLTQWHLEVYNMSETKRIKLEDDLRKAALGKNVSWELTGNLATARLVEALSELLTPQITFKLLVKFFNLERWCINEAIGTNNQDLLLCS